MNIINKHLFLFVMVCAFLMQNLCGQQGHNIRFNLTNYTDKEMVLAYHFGDKQYINDTLTATSPGKFAIKGAKELDPGMYIAYFPSLKSSFEFIVSQGDQNFELTADLKKTTSTLNVTNSKENTLFFDYLKFLEKKRQLAQPINIELKKLKQNKVNPNTEKIQSLEGKIQNINTEVTAYQKGLVDANAKSFTAKLILLSREVKLPDAVKNDMEKSRKYVKEHFFDGVDFSDLRFTYSPLLYPKFDLYLDKVTEASPQAVIASVDHLLSLIAMNKELYKYTVIRLLNKYSKTRIACMDAVYVHIADNYYSKGKTPWIVPNELQKIQADADALRPIRCGEKAPDIVMKTVSNPDVVTRLSLVEAKYTVLWIWSPDSKEALYHLYDFNKYNKNYRAKGVKVFAVCTNTRVKCDKAIKKEKIEGFINVADYKNVVKTLKLYNVRSGSEFYLLNKDKTILIKSITPRDLSKAIDYFESK